MKRPWKDSLENKIATEITLADINRGMFTVFILLPAGEKGGMQYQGGVGI